MVTTRLNAMINKIVREIESVMNPLMKMYSNLCKKYSIPENNEIAAW